MKISDPRAAVFVVSAAALAAGLAIDRDATLAAYLVAWIGLGSIPIGALGILMLSYLVRWNWTLALRPVLIPALAALPVVALLILPILIWMASLYPAAADPASLPPFKALYLAPWFFSLRAIAYFVIWSLLALWLRNAGRDSDRMARAASAGIHHLRVVAVAGRSGLAGIAGTGFSFLDLRSVVRQFCDAEAGSPSRSPRGCGCAVISVRSRATAPCCCRPF